MPDAPASETPGGDRPSRHQRRSRARAGAARSLRGPSRWGLLGGVLLGCDRADEPPKATLVELADAALVVGAPGEALGSTVAAVGDPDGDGADDLALAGTGDRVCLAPVGLGDDTEADLLSCVSGEPGAGFGASAAPGPALAGGAVGWAVGAPGSAAASAATDPADPGGVHVLAGLEPYATLTGESDLDRFGATLVAADFDADGAVDLLVGAPGADRLVDDVGSAHVYFGPLDAGVHPADASGARFDGGQLARHAGEAGYALAGSAGVVDADGDGVVDLLLSQGGTDTEQDDVGAVFVFLGPMRRATVAAPQYADAMLVGTRPAEYAGEPCAGAGDLDADGRDDVVVVANGLAPERVAVFSGPTGGARTLDGAEVVLEAARSGEVTGWAVTGGDFDGDDQADLLVGSPGGGDGAGEIRVLVGPLEPGVVSLADLPVIGGAGEAGRALAPAGATGFAVGMPGSEGGAGSVALFGSALR